MSPASPASCALDLDQLSAAVVVPGAVEHGRDRADGAVHRRAVVGEVAGPVARGELREARRPQGARCGQRGQGLEVPSGPWTAQPEVGQGDVDEMRMTFGDRVDTDVLDQHVGVGQELVEPGSVLDVQHHAALVGVAVRVRERVRMVPPARPGSRRRRSRRGCGRRARRADRSGRRPASTRVVRAVPRPAPASAHPKPTGRPHWCERPRRASGPTASPSARTSSGRTRSGRR